MLSSVPYSRLSLAIAVAVLWFVPPVMAQEVGETGEEEAVAAAQQTPNEQGTEEETAAADESKESAEKKEGDDQEQKKKKDEVELHGYMTAIDEYPIVVKPEEWKEFAVKSVLAHGTEVKPGDVLLEFEVTKYERALVDLEHEIALGRLSVAQAQQKLDLQRKSTRLAMATAERAERKATEDLKRFLTVGHDNTKESLEFAVRSAKNYLAYQEEELKQLTKMYEADDLTEETEEIILRRTKDSVDTARYSLDRAKQRRDDGMEVNLPRSEETLEDAVKQATVALERARATLPPQVTQAELELDKLQLKQERLVERLNRLRKDRQWLAIEAPAAGIVYYGRQQDGKWSDPNQLQNTLKQGGVVKPNQTIITVVRPEPLKVMATTAEADLPHVEPGTSGTAVPTAFPDRKLKVSVEQLSAVPSGEGKFTTTLIFDARSGLDGLVPGMTCKVHIKKASVKKEEE